MGEIASVQIVGAKEAIRYLGQVDKELRKEFTREAKQIAQPLVTAAQSKYPERFLSGMVRAWSQKGRQLFPYNQGKARRGVKVQVSSSRRQAAVVTVVQKDPAASIIEFAGKKDASPFSARLSQASRPPARVMWPAAESKYRDVQAEMEDAVDRVVTKMNGWLL